MKDFAKMLEIEFSKIRCIWHQWKCNRSVKPKGIEW